MKNKKSNKLGFLFIVILIVSGAILYNKYFPTTEVTEEAPIVREVKDDKLDAVLNEADFKKATELRAKKIILDRDRKEEMTRHEERLKEIEAGLEALRAEELTLGKSNQGF